MLKLSPEESSLLDAVLDRIVPADDFPSAVAAGVRAFIESRFEALPATVEIYRAGLTVLQAHGFAGLSATEQDALLGELEGHPSIALIIAQTLEGYYAGIDSAGARMVGFRVTA